MEVGDLFEVLVALAVVLAGLLGGGKKKKKPQQSPRRPQPRPRPSPGWDVQQATGSDRIVEDLRRRLEAARGDVVAKVTEVPEAYSLETYERPQESLETMEAAGVASHERFHEQYIHPLDQVRMREPRAARPPGGLRSAVVWAEILGPPKGLKF